MLNLHILIYVLDRQTVRKTDSKPIKTSARNGPQSQLMSEGGDAARAAASESSACARATALLALSSASSWHMYISTGIQLRQTIFIR